MRLRYLLAIVLSTFAAKAWSQPGGCYAYTTNTHQCLIIHGTPNWDTFVNSNAQAVDTAVGNILPVTGGTITGTINFGPNGLLQLPSWATSPATQPGFVGWNTTTQRYDFGVPGSIVNYVKLNGDSMTGLLKNSSGFDLVQSALQEELPNNTSSGATLNKIAIMNSSGQAQTATTSSTMWSGVVTGGATGSTAGSTIIARTGVALCVFDGSTTIGDYVQISIITGGDCHDVGSTYPITGAIVGRAVTTNGGAGTTASVNLYSPGILTGGPSTGISSNGTTGQVWGMTGTSTQGWFTPTGSGTVSSGGSSTAIQFAGYASPGTTVQSYSSSSFVGCPLATTLGFDATGTPGNAAKWNALLAANLAANKQTCVFWDSGGTFDFTDAQVLFPNSGGSNFTQPPVTMETRGLNFNSSASALPVGSAILRFGYTPPATITITSGGTITNEAFIIAPESNLHTGGAQGTGFTTGDTITATDCATTQWVGTVTAVSTAGPIKSITITNPGSGCPSHLNGTALDTAWTTSGSGTGAQLYVYSFPVGSFPTTSSPTVGQRIMLSGFTGETNLNGATSGVFGTVVSANGTTMVLNFPWAILANNASLSSGAGVPITGLIDTRGYGSFSLEGAQIVATNCLPIIFDTNTVLSIRRNLFVGVSSGSSACNDVLRLGGNSSSIGGLDTDKYNGYTFHFDNNYLWQIRRWAHLATATNAGHIENNYSQTTTGNAQQDGAAILIDSSMSNGDYTNNGNHINHNECECTNYSHFAVSVTGLQNEFIGNNLYDTNGTWVAGYLSMSEFFPGEAGLGFNKIDSTVTATPLYQGPDVTDRILNPSSNQPSYAFMAGGPVWMRSATGTGSYMVYETSSGTDYGVVNGITGDMFSWKFTDGTNPIWSLMYRSGWAGSPFAACTFTNIGGVGFVQNCPWSSYYKIENTSGPLYLIPGSSTNPIYFYDTNTYWNNYGMVFKGSGAAATPANGNALNFNNAFLLAWENAAGSGQNQLASDANDEPTWRGNEVVQKSGAITSGNCLQSATLNGNVIGVADSGAPCSGFTLSTSGVGGFFAPHIFQSSATQNPTSVLSGANVVRVNEFVLPFGITVNKIAVGIATASASGHADVCIYSRSSGSAGGSLLISTGGVSTTSTGAQYITLGSTVTLNAGVYWLAWTADNTTAQLYGIAQGSTLDVLRNAVSQLHVGTAANAATAGVCPGTLGTVTQGTFNSAVMWLQP